MGAMVGFAWASLGLEGLVRAGRAEKGSALAFLVGGCGGLVVAVLAGGVEVEGGRGR